MRATSMDGAGAEAEMRGTACEQLLLAEQAGSDIDLPADGKGIDPLVAGGPPARGRECPSSDSDFSPLPSRRTSVPRVPSRSSRPSPSRSTTAATDASRVVVIGWNWKRSSASQTREVFRRAPDRGRRCCRGRPRTARRAPSFGRGSRGARHQLPFVPTAPARIEARRMSPPATSRRCRRCRRR